MFEKLCICSLMPKIETKAKLCLIIQNREIIKPSNTGALAAKCLANSEIHIRGNIGEPLDYESMMDESYENIFLFPTEKAEPLTDELVGSIKKPIKLFVADGNWGQAIRIHRRFVSVNSVRSVFLPPGSPTQYQLRKEHNRPEGLATMEAIARAFGYIEGKSVEDQLSKIFLTMVSRTLASRGLNPDGTKNRTFKHGLQSSKTSS
jgi:DTW domain-containing protein YfiP